MAKKPPPSRKANRRVPTAPPAPVAKRAKGKAKAKPRMPTLGGGLGGLGAGLME